MLECVPNVSEGRRRDLIDALAAAAGPAVLDVHVDPDHNRSVFTLCGPDDELWAAVTGLARAAVSRLDITAHSGVHPRIGVLDVVPFVDLDEPTAVTSAATAMRDRFAAWIERELGVPSACYGPERTLPDVRRAPPASSHPTAGAVAVGARGVLVAYNLWLAGVDIATTRAVAAAVRRPGVRTLGLALPGWTQVSCNLIEPYRIGPAEVYDLVAARVPVHHAELVGLLPAALLDAVDAGRWATLGLSREQTIEARLR